MEKGWGLFCFEQKTAYEMLRSLVGSEMCIGDGRLATRAELGSDPSSYARNKTSGLAEHMTFQFKVNQDRCDFSRDSF